MRKNEIIDDMHKLSMQNLCNDQIDQGISVWVVHVRPFLYRFLPVQRITISRLIRHGNKNAG